MAAPLASVAVVVLVIAGFAVFGLPRTTSTPPVGVTPTPTTTATPTPTPPPTPTLSSGARAIVTVAGWERAVDRSLLPYSDELRATRDCLGIGDQMCHAVHYVRNGRSTGLRVEALGAHTYGPVSGTPEQILSRQCTAEQIAYLTHDATGATCDPIRDTDGGPVLVIRGPDSITAVTVGSSRVLLTVTSYGGDFPGPTSYDFPLAGTPAQDPPNITGTGQPGVDLDTLVAMATAIPTPHFTR